MQKSNKTYDRPKVKYPYCQPNLGIIMLPINGAIIKPPKPIPVDVIPIDNPLFSLNDSETADVAGTGPIAALNIPIIK